MADNTNKQPQVQPSAVPQAAPKKAAPQPAPAKQAPTATVKQTSNPPKAAPKKFANAKVAAPSSAAKKIAAQPKIAATTKKEDKSCSGRWNRLTGCGKFTVFWYLFWLSPFILEGSIWILIIGALIPIGFLFGLIKHKAPILWFIIAVIVNIGGLADLSADIWLLLRMLLYYMTGYKVNPFGSMTEEEQSLFFARLIVTLITGVPSVILMFFMNSTVWVTLTGEKKANVAKSSADGAVAIMLMIIWKLAMVFARVTIIWQIFKSLIKHKKITEETEKNTKFWEIAATLEVLWSAIPLGILTGLEAFYFEDISHVTPTKIWELIKLGALAIDLIGVSFFIYFELIGLNKVVHKCMGEHEHHEAAINQAEGEKAPLIVEQTSSILAPSDSNV